MMKKREGKKLFVIELFSKKEKIMREILIREMPIEMVSSLWLI